MRNTGASPLRFFPPGAGDSRLFIAEGPGRAFQTGHGDSFCVAWNRECLPTPGRRMQPLPAAPSLAVCLPENHLTSRRSCPGRLPPEGRRSPRSLSPEEPDPRKPACAKERTAPGCQNNPSSATYTLCDFGQVTETSRTHNLVKLLVSKPTHLRLNVSYCTPTPYRLHQQVLFVLAPSISPVCPFPASPPSPPRASPRYRHLEVCTSPTCTPASTLAPIAVISIQPRAALRAQPDREAAQSPSVSRTTLTVQWAVCWRLPTVHSVSPHNPEGKMSIITPSHFTVRKRRSREAKALTQSQTSEGQSPDLDPGSLTPSPYPGPHAGLFQIRHQLPQVLPSVSPHQAPHLAPTHRAPLTQPPSAGRAHAHLQTFGISPSLATWLNSPLHPSEPPSSSRIPWSPDLEDGAQPQVETGVFLPGCCWSPQWVCMTREVMSRSVSSAVVYAGKA